MFGYLVILRTKTSVFYANIKKFIDYLSGALIEWRIIFESVSSCVLSRWFKEQWMEVASELHATTDLFLLFVNNDAFSGTSIQLIHPLYKHVKVFLH